MKWREEWSINKDDGWQPPQVLVDYMPSGISGYDKEGSPVIVIPFAGFDLCGLLKSAPPKDMVRFLAQKLDLYLEVARQSSLKHGPKASQVSCIVDLTDFNLRQFTWKPVCVPTDTVVFDNSYSFLRGKKLAYNVRITLPVKEKTIRTIDQMVNIEE
ncbi:PREDICTED: SEC14-like protein 2 [Diuraphis noxia]|uniref:SEC14-like protein 2 n=1 Tax=Diuraphis noxia TaxID=143948 RepID=UPI000763562D|nr:PREDICTED: SEC14-like protein 2 [Diuraphis noxia]